MRQSAMVCLGLLVACGSDGNPSPDVDAGHVPDPDDAPGLPLGWTASDESIPNPERGFYRYTNLVSDRDFAFVRAGNDSLIFSYVRLDAFREGPIAQPTIDDAAAGLAAARAAGVKVVLRFAYNEGPYPDSEPDASLAQVLAHIDQLTPLLQQNADVIAVVQAGFIGAWGEWHTSTNGLDVDPAARRQVVEALLEALPESRGTQLRYPPFKQALYGDPLDDTTGWTATYAARTGHHNDCFLASETDFGTYPDGEVESWKAYIAADARFVAMGGETCALYPARTDCAPAAAEMARLHVSFLNRDYNTDVVDAWQLGGCLDDLERQMGYRLVPVDGELPAAVRPGGSFRVRVRVRNDGFAAPYNPRSIWLVLDGSGDRFELELPGSDARRFAAGETVGIDVRVRIPASTAAGVHRLSLWLPDDAASIRARPEYAIRLAAVGTWDDATGLNVLAEIVVDPAAGGTADPAADGFELLP